MNSVSNGPRPVANPGPRLGRGYGIAAARLALLFLLAAASPVTGAAAGERAVFDHTLLTLSWAPAFCAAANAPSRECAVGGRFAFIVHGLWPSSARESARDTCPISSHDRVSPEIIRQMQPLMPDAYLVNHEWRAHGSCSGLGQAGYFQAIRTSAAALIIPAPLRGPTASFQTTADALKTAFVEANRGLNPSSLKIGCKDGALSQVQLCLGLDARTPQPCARPDRSCGNRPFTVLPVH